MPNVLFTSVMSAFPNIPLMLLHAMVIREAQTAAYVSTLQDAVVTASPAERTSQSITHACQDCSDSLQASRSLNSNGSFFIDQPICCKEVTRIFSPPHKPAISVASHHVYPSLTARVPFNRVPTVPRWYRYFRTRV